MNHTTRLPQFEVIQLRLADGTLSVDCDAGAVYSRRKNIYKQFSICIRPNGYAVIGLSFKGVRYVVLVHRLFWFACMGDIPDGLQIDHINRNKLDNQLCNLRIVTPQENLKHRDLSNQPKGEQQRNSKLTRNEVLEIRDLYAYGYGTYETIGKLYKVNLVTIHDIVRRVTWKHI